MMSFYEDTKAGVNFKIEQLLIVKDMMNGWNNYTNVTTYFR